MATDTSEKGLETIIEACLIDTKGEKEESLRWIKKISENFNPRLLLRRRYAENFLAKYADG
jgi:GH24 family phage-related lysozyme (muramidase)